MTRRNDRILTLQSYYIAILLKLLQLHKLHKLHKLLKLLKLPKLLKLLILLKLLKECFDKVGTHEGTGGLLELLSQLKSAEAFREQKLVIFPFLSF